MLEQIDSTCNFKGTIYLLVSAFCVCLFPDHLSISSPQQAFSWQYGCSAVTAHAVHTLNHNIHHWCRSFVCYPSSRAHPAFGFAHSLHQCLLLLIIWINITSHRTAQHDITSNQKETCMFRVNLLCTGEVFVYGVPEGVGGRCLGLGLWDKQWMGG